MAVGDAQGAVQGEFAEEIDPGTGDHLGNFLQALSYAARVQAAALALGGNR